MLALLPLSQASLCGGREICFDGSSDFWPLPLRPLLREVWGPAFPQLSCWEVFACSGTCRRFTFMTAALGGRQGGAWACWLPDVVAVGGRGAIRGARSHRTWCYFLEGWLTLESFSVAHFYHSEVSTDKLAIPVWDMS